MTRVYVLLIATIGFIIKEIFFGILSPIQVIENIGKWGGGAVGAFFGTLANNLIGFVIAYIVYLIYKNTKVSSQQEKFVATINIFFKIYELKVKNLSYDYFIDERSVDRKNIAFDVNSNVNTNINVENKSTQQRRALVGEAAITGLLQACRSAAVKSHNNKNNIFFEPAEEGMIEHIIASIKPIINSISILEAQLTSSDTHKTEIANFFKIVKAYISEDFVALIQILANSTGYTVKDEMTLKQIKHLHASFNIALIK
jgi:hypothetical protein